jgi:hypothetical protein
MLIPASIEEPVVTSRGQFETEVVAAGEPRVLRGFASRLPAVQAAARSDVALAEYLRGFHNDTALSLMTGSARSDTHDDPAFIARLTLRRAEIRSR